MENYAMHRGQKVYKESHMPHYQFNYNCCVVYIKHLFQQKKPVLILHLLSQDGMSGKEALIFYCCSHGLNLTSTFMRAI